MKNKNYSINIIKFIKKNPWGLFGSFFGWHTKI
jgi:hypothetical protein